VTLNIEEIIAKAAPRTVDVPVCLGGDLLTAHEQAAVELQQALDADDGLVGTDEVRAAAEKVTEIEEQLEEQTVTFRLRALSRKEWADLLAKFPPSVEQRRAGHDADPDLFPVAAIAASIVEPEMTEDEFRRLSESPLLTFGDFQKLFLAVMRLNVPPTTAPKLAAATELLRLNGPSSTTPAAEGFPDLGSLAGSGEQ